MLSKGSEGNGICQMWSGGIRQMFVRRAGRNLADDFTGWDVGRRSVGKGMTIFDGVGNSVADVSLLKTLAEVGWGGIW